MFVFFPMYYLLFLNCYIIYKKYLKVSLKMFMLVFFLQVMCF